MISKIEALRAMKTRRGEETIILFHNGVFFEAYEQDAAVVAKITGLVSDTIEGIPTIRIPESEQEAIMDKLLDADCAVCISEMRDSEGHFVVNINKEEDYEEEQ